MYEINSKYIIHFELPRCVEENFMNENTIEIINDNILGKWIVKLDAVKDKTKN